MWLHLTAGIDNDTLSQDALHDPRRFDPGQSGIEALGPVREPFMLDAHQVKNSCVQIGNMNGINDGVLAIVIRCSVSHTTLTPPPAIQIVK